MSTPRTSTVVLNQQGAADLEATIGPLPEGAVTVSEPVRIEPEQRWVVPNRRDRRAASNLPVRNAVTEQPLDPARNAVTTLSPAGTSIGNTVTEPATDWALVALGGAR